MKSLAIIPLSNKRGCVYALWGKGGLFVLDMGEPVKIVELPEEMTHLSRLSVRSEKNVNGDISIEFSGLHPGEKNYEELLNGDNVVSTLHPMTMSFNEGQLPWEMQKASKRSMNPTFKVTT